MTHSLHLHGTIVSAWKQYRNHIPLTIGAFLVIFAITWVVNTLAMFASRSTAGYIIMQIVTTLIGLYLSLGLSNFLLMIIRGKTPAIKDLFLKGSMFGTTVLSSILLALMFIGVFLVPALLWLLPALAGSTAAIWSVLAPIAFVLLGIVALVLALGVQFFMYVIIDGENKPLTAIKKSFAITKGFRWKLFLMWLAIFAGYAFLFGAVLGVAFIPRAGIILALILGIAAGLVFVPFLNIILVQAYDTLKKGHHSA